MYDSRSKDAPADRPCVYPERLFLTFSRSVMALCRDAVVRFLLVDARGKIDIRLLRMNLPGLPGLGCGDSFGENSGHA